MYYDFIDDEGNRMAQVNAGGADARGHFEATAPTGDPLHIYATTTALLDGTDDLEDHTGTLVFEGDEADVQEALNYIIAFKEYINSTAGSLPSGDLPTDSRWRIF